MIKQVETMSGGPGEVSNYINNQRIIEVEQAVPAPPGVPAKTIAHCARRYRPRRRERNYYCF